MRRFLPFALILVLSACGAPRDEEIIIVEPVLEEAAAEAGVDPAVCGDDGIGGTGCPEQSP